VARGEPSAPLRSFDRFFCFGATGRSSVSREGEDGGQPVAITRGDCGDERIG